MKLTVEIISDCLKVTKLLQSQAIATQTASGSQGPMACASPQFLSSSVQVFGSGQLWHVLAHANSHWSSSAAANCATLIKTNGSRSKRLNRIVSELERNVNWGFKHGEFVGNIPICETV